MPNKTIYIKDEALWDKAKELAGKQGLSAQIEKALAEFVEQTQVAKDAQTRGLVLHSIEIFDADNPNPNDVEVVRFWGKLLADSLLGQGPDHRDAVAEVYQTRAGKLVLVLKDAITYEAFEYRTFDTLDELRRHDCVSQIHPDHRMQFLDSIGSATGHKWATWID